jgi:single-stranded-DNA-specific exonuclease
MPIKDKRWIIKPEQGSQELLLKEQLNIHPVLCKLLNQRGVTTYDNAKSYFRPDLNMMHSPWLLKGMELAVDRILKAIKENEKIIVYGD